MAHPATPLPASTVVLARPGHRNRTEVFTNRRPESMDTYAGIYVFPGGRVELSDWSAEMLKLTRGMLPAEARAALASELQPDICLGYWVAAVRELFEEAGIHFFVDTAAIDRDEETLAQMLASKRQALQQGKFDLSTLLEAENLVCDLSRLRYIFHRITPEHYKIRFDTRFYIAALPKNQTPLPASEEVEESLWISPEAALIASESGKFRMMPPTIAVLRALASYPEWGDLRHAYNL